MTDEPDPRAPVSILRSAWPIRIVWLVLPVVMGPSIEEALADRSRAVQVVASLLAWVGWGMTLAAMAVLRSVSLTVVRAIVPAALPVALWATWGTDRAGWAGAGIASAAIALLLLAGPGMSDAFVDGSSYGTERRVALRLPLPLLLLPVPAAWAIGIGGVVAGALLLAAEQWVAGSVVAIVGSIAAAVVARRLHLLSRRWLVFVPAGIVVHDPLTMTDAVLFPRSQLERIGPATGDATDGADVVDTTGGALGLVLEIRGSMPVKVGLREGRRAVERDGIQSLLVTPTQPAETLAIARQARMPVG